MNVLKTAVQEVIGLFIEDGRYAASIAAWILIAWFALPRMPVPQYVKAILLFAGFAALLLDSVVRAARTP